MKRISILGSTGSIGVNTLDVVKRNPDQFEVLALAAHSNLDIIVEQCYAFKPKIVSLFDTSKLKELKARLNGLGTEVVGGQEGSVLVATLPEVDTVVSGMVGCAGLMPTYEALKAGKCLALANKETLVVAGELMVQTAYEKGCTIIPIDSEHSAIFQALNGENPKRIKRIILTASGGPFRTWTCEDMETVTKAQALKHPNWDMGPKITIDSATMMNKGLEYIEAKWLFGTETEVKILVHPQSIIHSMIEFVDTSVIAQLGLPDMRVPIAYALSFPDRIECELESLDLAKLAQLTFEAPDFRKFPCLQLAHDALEIGQTMPAVLNAANEIAVQGFLDELIPFKEIPEIIRLTMEHHTPQAVRSIDDVLKADQWARDETQKLVTVAH